MWMRLTLSKDFEYLVIFYRLYKVNGWLGKKMHFSFILEFYIQNYFEIAICTMINLGPNTDLRLSGESFSLSISLLLFFFTNLLGIYLFILVISNN